VFCYVFRRLRSGDISVWWLRCGLDGPGFESQKGKLFLFSRTFFLFVYRACSTTLVVLHDDLQFIYMYSLVLMLFITYSLLCFISSKSIDSINQPKIFWCLLIRSCLLVGHVLICCNIISRCVLVLSQWNRRWSIDWYSLPHLHIASCLRWNLCKYAFVNSRTVQTDTEA
jgi:hypothetical protein